MLTKQIEDSTDLVALFSFIMPIEVEYAFFKEALKILNPVPRLLVDPIDTTNRISDNGRFYINQICTLLSCEYQHTLEYQLATNNLERAKVAISGNTNSSPSGVKVIALRKSYLLKYSDLDLLLMEHW